MDIDNSYLDPATAMSASGTFSAATSDPALRATPAFSAATSEPSARAEDVYSALTAPSSERAIHAREDRSAMPGASALRIVKGFSRDVTAAAERAAACTLGNAVSGFGRHFGDVPVTQRA